MDQQVSRVVVGGLFFTGLYLILKCGNRLQHEFANDCYKSVTTDVKTRVCTWSMGALGCGLLYSVVKHT